MNEQFEKFISYENFYLAFKRLQTVPGYSLYKNLYREDLKYFGFQLNENIEILTDRIKENIYGAEKSYKIYIPKKNNLVRPLTLLKFFDLLIYQALANVIGDILYDEFSIYHNKNIFGNLYRKSGDQDAIFFFYKWKKQWKAYNNVTEKYYNEGFQFFSDFDIASFFDTINHKLLSRILNDKGVDNSITDYLEKCLETWTSSITRNNLSINQGIPQGPLASALLANIYLLPIDEKILKNKNLKIKYLRYVDDIRILSKEKIEGQKSIAYLDLLARDFGLIPQSSKIAIRKVENIKRELSFKHNKLSVIADEFYREGKKLTEKTHKKQKKEFLRCFKQPSKEDPNEDFLNKTIISFSLFKLNKDDEIKKTLLDNFSSLAMHIEGVLFYFSKYYSTDKEILELLSKIIKEDNLLFQHTIAMIYKNIPNLPFDENLFYRHYERNRKFWLIKYYILDWLYQQKEYELIKSLEYTNNYYIDRQILSYKLNKTKGKTAQKRILLQAMQNQDAMTAIQGLYYYKNLFFTPPQNISSLNLFVQSIFSTDNKIDYINFILKKHFGLTESHNFFSEKFWNNKDLYNELKFNFYLFFQHIELDPSISLMSLNNFNEIIFRKIMYIKTGKELPKRADFGGSIKQLKDDFPISCLYFEIINDARNEKTYAHYKDKLGNLRVKINFNQYEALLRKSKFKQAIEEICMYEYKKFRQ